MRRTAILLLCYGALAGPAWAQSDLDRIPQAASAAPPEPAPASDRVVYLQSDLTLNSAREGLPVPLSPPPQWEARLFADARLSWQIGGDLSVSYSGRLNLRAQDGLAFPGRETVRHDFREAYLSWQHGDWFVQVGRINLKSGVGLGFNPTDYFKTRAVVDPDSADPTVLREDRLGTVMAAAQALWRGGSVTLAVAPKLAGETPPYLNTNLPGFDPGFDRTNARWRMLAKASVDLPGGLSPEFLLYRERGGTQFGLNLTEGIGQAVVAYVEWSGGRSQGLIARALEDGAETGILTSPPPFRVDTAKAFRNDLAAGFSYATDIGVDLEFEFDYHQAGFSGADWRDWFDAGSRPPWSGEMWFIRGYAADEQEPVARNSVFLRADWRNALVHDLSLTGFVDADLRDGSGLAQFAANYDLSPRWTVGALADAYCGRARSDFGSLPKSASVLAKVSRYF